MQADTIESLRDRVEELETLLGADLNKPLMWLGFTSQQAEILGLLLKRQCASRDTISRYLWPNDGPEFQDNAIKVRIYQIRRKLNGMGIPNAIQSRWGQGYALWPGIKDKINARIADRAVERRL